ncbi:MAG: M23 family metallopeptidase [Alistipes sp.]|nr:M23 family metallopeptidase [Alistipes sp.]
MNEGFWNNLTRKRLLSMRNRETGESYWKIHISPLALGVTIVASFVVITSVLLLLMAYTSILDVLPGYRTKAERMTDELTENIMRIDAMERTMSDSLKYNEMVTAILSGNTPTLHSTVMTDTIRYDKSTVLASRADSLLRRALESTEGEYSLSNTKPLKAEAAMFSTPMRGSVTRRFDAPESSYDMAIMSLGGDFSVMAVEGGTVIEVVRGSDALGEIIIQHGEGYMSVYKQLGEVLVRKGQHIAAGTVIGRVGDLEMAGEEQSPELVFELWRNGTAVDPERYILF